MLKKIVLLFALAISVASTVGADAHESAISAAVAAYRVAGIKSSTVFLIASRGRVHRLVIIAREAPVMSVRLLSSRLRVRLEKLSCSGWSGLFFT